MCLIKLKFGYSEEDLCQAQQAVVDRFRRAIPYNQVDPNTQETVRQALEAIIHFDPEEWIAAAARALTTLIADQQATIDALERDLNTLRWERDGLRDTVDAYQNDPLQEQVAALEDDCHAWQRQASRLQQRVQELESSLERAQKAHQAEVTQLEQKIAALQDTIVHQRQQLNATRP
jgi:chromosome segregation ATPase